MVADIPHDAADNEQKQENQHQRTSISEPAPGPESGLGAVCLKGLARDRRGTGHRGVGRSAVAVQVVGRSLWAMAKL